MCTQSLRNTVAIVCICAALKIAMLSLAVPAFAERASLVIDADNGVVLYVKNARLKSFPASLTKLMTVYLVFEAMALEKPLTSYNSSQNGKTSSMQ